MTQFCTLTHFDVFCDGAPSGVARVPGWASPVGRVAHPEGQNEEETK